LVGRITNGTLDVLDWFADRHRHLPANCENACFLILPRGHFDVKMVPMAVAETTSVRPYRGVEPADRLAARHSRLLAAGLDVLGADPRGPSELTVRGVCRRAGVAARYFYESFANKDDFVGAVFDWVIADLAATTQAAAAAALAEEQTRAVMADIVRTIEGDPRVGRLLFSSQPTNPVLVRKREESSALFVMLSGQHAGAALRMSENDRIKAAAHFVVGGVGQTLSAWLAGEVRMSPDQLVDHLASLIDQLGDPALYRD
jgi:AcrR family transcriptional regulator